MTAVDKVRDESREQKPPFRGHHPPKSRGSAGLWTLPHLPEEWGEGSDIPREKPRKICDVSRHLSSQLVSLVFEALSNSWEETPLYPAPLWQEQVSRFADGLSPAGSREQICIEAPPTCEAEDDNRVWEAQTRAGAGGRALGHLRHGLGSTLLILLTLCTGETH